MLNHWRLLLLIIIVIGAVLSIGFRQYPYGRQGVEVVFVNTDSPARNAINEGDIITHVNGNRIQDKTGWDAAISGLAGTIKLRANGEDREIQSAGGLGITVDDIERTNLDFGLDIRGGTRVILKPKENITYDVLDQLISTLETRANIYGLREIKFQPIAAGSDFLIQVDSAGLQSSLIEDLLSAQGQFEAKILKPADISNGGQLQLGSSTFSVEISGDAIKINGSEYRINETFTLGGIQLEYVNRTDESLFLLAKVYEGADIELIPADPQSSAIYPQQGGYSFFFTIIVSNEGAQRFADVTAGIPGYLDLQTGERYLNSQLILYLDGQPVSELRISEELRGDIFTSPQISGFRETESEAFEEKLRLQTILRSGALPTGLETVSVNTISPTLGDGFFYTSIYSASFAALLVFAIVLIRYRSIKTALPLIIISFSEVLIILGIAAAGDTAVWSAVLLINLLLVSVVWWKKHEADMLAYIGAVLIPLLGMMSWTIDLPAIGGLIAAIGTGVDQQIIIADEAIKGRRREGDDFKGKIKTAMFIIFGAAATVIAAMMPLIFIGIGALRGFAITTMVGVFVGFLITRPAYAKIMEAIMKNKNKTPEASVESK